MSNPNTRMIAPATKPVGREDATPRYGSGNVKMYMDIGTVKRVAVHKSFKNTDIHAYYINKHLDVGTTMLTDYQPHHYS